MQVQVDIEPAPCGKKDHRALVVNQQALNVFGFLLDAFAAMKNIVK